MSRRYADRIQVSPVAALAGTVAEPAERSPQSFRWRRERYQVVAVLARWVEASAWWRGAVPGSGSTDHPAGSFERIVWRVEARTRAGTGGVFDLGHDLPADRPGGSGETHPGGDRWFLVRAMD